MPLAVDFPQVREGGREGGWEGGRETPNATRCGFSAGSASNIPTCNIIDSLIKG